MRSSNPMMNERTFTDLAMERGDRTMTAQGAATKAIILLGLALLTAAWGWHFYDQATKTLTPRAVPWLIGGLAGGLVLAVVTSFKKDWAGVTAPLYALCEGLVLGLLSSFFEAEFPGIVIQAVALTFGTAICMLMAYKLGIVRATEKFKMGVVAATGAIAVVYLVSLVGQMVFHRNMPYLHDATPLGIAISGVIVIVAALNLVLDFDLIETGAARGAPKSYEWYGAFALLVTLVWLYMELLRLLSKLRSRN